MNTIEIKPETKVIVSKLTDFVNSSSRLKNDEFIMSLEREHRTLQQSSARLFLQFLEHAATIDYKVDDRNKSTQKISKILMKGFAIAMAEELQKQGQNVTPEMIEKNWDVYKPSAWLGYI